MLSVAKLASEQARYYLDDAAERVDVADSLGEGAEDYYLDPDEARGQWGGAGAERLRVRGDVEAVHLRRLLGGVHPTSGLPLRADGRRVTVAALDATFSAPKSVSVLFGVADSSVQEAIRRAHDVAVGEALGYLDQHAAAVRRGAGGAEVHQVDGLVVAQFRHRSSRAGDPQLHTHAVIANGAYGPDGRWSALDGRRVFAHAPTASRVYQAVLRAELSRSLGLEWTAVSRGIAEVVGIPEPVRRAFSQRRAEIEAALTERGTSGNRAAEAAALATRRRKDRSIGSTALQSEWRRRAAELGFDARACERVVGRRAECRGGGLDEAVQRLVREGDALTARSSTFSRRDVVAALCETVSPGTPLDRASLDAAADLVLGSSEIVALTDDGERETFRTRDGRLLRVGADDRRYTTAALLAIEQRLVASVDAGRDAGRGVAPAEATDAAIAERPSLSDEQREMVQALTTRGDAVAVVAGRAGTGKTYTLAAAHDAWRSSGVPVVGVAVARRAAQELSTGAGIGSTSVSALLARLDRAQQLLPGTVLVVDEAGMLGTRDMARLADHVEAARGKLVLVGDDRQLPEIDAGGLFRGLVRRGYAVELAENRRQTEPWERRAVEQLRDGEVRVALAAYRAHDRVHVSPTDPDARACLVSDWLSGNGDCVMIAARRLDVDDLNLRAREQLCATGRLGEAELDVGRRPFSVGDRVVLRINDSRLGVANGERGTVTALDADRHTLTISTDQGETVLDSRYLRRRTRDGDPAVAHGYAVTCHVAQGATVDRAFVLADAGLCREWGYTALTRGRRENHLYIAETSSRERDEFAPRGRHDDQLPALERLAVALERSEAQPLALDRGRRDRDDARREGLGR